jgi:hypothetical protein
MMNSGASRMSSLTYQEISDRLNQLYQYKNDLMTKAVLNNETKQKVKRYQESIDYYTELLKKMNRYTPVTSYSSLSSQSTINNDDKESDDFSSLIHMDINDIPMSDFDNYDINSYNNSYGKSSSSISSNSFNNMSNNNNNNNNQMKNMTANLGIQSSTLQQIHSPTSRTSKLLNMNIWNTNNHQNVGNVYPFSMEQGINSQSNQEKYFSKSSKSSLPNQNMYYSDRYQQPMKNQTVQIESIPSINHNRQTLSENNRNPLNKNMNYSQQNNLFTTISKDNENTMQIYKNQPINYPSLSREKSADISIDKPFSLGTTNKRTTNEQMNPLLQNNESSTRNYQKPEEDDDVITYSELSEQELNNIAEHDLQDLDDLIEDDISSYEIDCQNIVLPFYLNSGGNITSPTENDEAESEAQNLLQQMQRAEIEIKQTEADKMMDEWQEEVYSQEDDPYLNIQSPSDIIDLNFVPEDDIDDKQEEEDEDFVKQEMFDLEKQVQIEKRKQELFKSGIYLMDQEVFQNEFKYLEQEFQQNIRKKQLLEMFFYRLVLAEKERRRKEKGKSNDGDSDANIDKLVSEIKTGRDGKVIREYTSGKKVIINLPSRSIKVFLPNGHIITRYRNGDMKRIVPNKCIEHYNRNSQSCSILHADQSRSFYSFAMMLCEKRFPEQIINESGVEKITLIGIPPHKKLLLRQDGVREVLMKNGTKKLVPPKIIELK